MKRVEALPRPPLSDTMAHHYALKVMKEPRFRKHVKFLVKDFMNQKVVARKDFLWKQYVIAVAPYVIDKLVDIYKQ